MAAGSPTAAAIFGATSVVVNDTGSHTLTFTFPSAVADFLPGMTATGTVDGRLLLYALLDVLATWYYQQGYTSESIPVVNTPDSFTVTRTTNLAGGIVPAPYETRGHAATLTSIFHITMRRHLTEGAPVDETTYDPAYDS